ncbi:MAG: MBL fold metallo-hydrolase [Anaerolineae bacterium]|jgi:glyoxylase-like metal-dependent hydrolase (beta-lactamase superfamily II)|nr:MBL fold metallo-hydrolase [Anaerolineae bacterium]
MFQIGELTIHLINDSTTYVDPGGAFGLVPRALWSRYLTPNAEQLVPMANHNLYLEVNGRKIVIDTGLGTKLDDKSKAIWHIERPNGDLIVSLGRLGVSPEAIDLVIDTHLHFDHCAGNTRFNDQSEIVPTFPNAEYVVQRREYEDAMRPNERTAATYFPMNYQPLVESGQMRLLDGDTELAPGVWGRVTRGHTPGHMSIQIESGGQHLWFLCDLASYAVHFERLGWMTAYDVEPLETLETKRRWQAWALETDAILVFPHDTLRPAGRLRRDPQGRIALEALPVLYA